MSFISGLLGGHLLGVADEDGNIQLVDSRKAKCNSLIKGIYASSCFNPNCMRYLV